MAKLGPVLKNCKQPYEMHSTLLLLIMLRQWICAKIIFQIASSNIMYSWGYLSLCLIDRRGHECNVYHCVNKIFVFLQFWHQCTYVNVQCFRKIWRRFLLVKSVPMFKRQTDSTPIHTDEASHAGSRSNDYSSAFLWFSAPSTGQTMN